MARSRKVTSRALAAVGALIAVVLPVLPAIPATAASPGVADPARIANTVPFKYTPNFTNGAVKALVQVTHNSTTRMYVGGSYTSVSQVTSAGAAAAITRNYLLSFDPATGTLDNTFLPTVNGEVDTIVPTADGTGLYVGGRFTTIDGATTRLALINASTGALVSTFNASVNGSINDLALVGNHLLVGGLFNFIGSQLRQGIGSVDASTGAVETNYMALQLTGHHNYGVVPNSAQEPTGVQNIAVSPDGTRAIVDGNFTNATDSVNPTTGYSRDQIVSINLAGAATVDPGWQSLAYTNPCYNGSYDSYMRDISWSPDGSYFVVTATGGYFGGSFQDCDSASRFEASAAGSDVQPTWKALTGTDSIYSVAVTTDAVYIGGHARWINNPYGQDSPGPGAVPRPGLAALDPKTGVPLSWNPGRNPRGHGAEVVYATASGIWVGSDTDEIGNYQYKHQKLAFFPFAGGATPAGEDTGNPGTVFLAGSIPSTPASNVLYRVNAAGPTIQSPDAGPDWAADTSAAPSSLHNSGSNTSSYGATSLVTSAVPSYAPKALFSSERWDPGTNGDGNEMVWTFPTSSLPATDQIQVNLFFANRCTCTSTVGSRKFDIRINGQIVQPNYDIVADAGDQTGTMKSYTVTSVNGAVKVELDHEVENPLINGIELIDTSQSAVTNSLDTFSANSFNATDGSGGPASSQPSTGGGINWGSVRGAFMLNGRIWYGSTDSNFYYRTYDGANGFGPAMRVDPYADPYWSPVKTGSGQTYQGTATSFYTEIPNVTSMFYANHEIYYTLYHDARLYSRAFSPDTATSSVAGQVTGGVISPVEVVVSDPATMANVPNFNDASGMFLANGSLWYASRSTGALYQASWNGSAVTSTGTLDTQATGNWAARGLFLSPSAAVAPPVAAFTSSCSNLSCSFNGSSSTSSGSSISTYAWNFGDGSVGSGPTASHAFSAAGTYSVSLTVTNTAGGTNTSTQKVTVTPPPPVASFSSSCTGLTCTFDASASTAPGSSISSYAWNFGDGTSGSGVNASRTYAAGGTYPVTLTVTNASAGTNSTTQSVSVTSTTPPSSNITFVGSAATNGNATTESVVVPSAVTTGNGLILIAAGASGSAMTAPAGWTQLDTATSSGITTTVWTRVAVSTDAGSTVTVKYPSTYHGAVQLLAYSGTNSTNPVAAYAKKVSSVASTTSYATPTSSVPANGDVVLSYWAVKSSSVNSWTAPLGQTVRSADNGSGGGRINALATDGGQVNSGPTGGITATTDAAATTFSGWTIVLDGSGGTTPPPPSPPVAAFSSSCTGLACMFDGSTSTAPGSSITSYAWTFGDGASGSGMTVNHTYAAAATYSVTLTVQNTVGATNSTTQSVTVAATPPPSSNIAYVGQASTNGNALTESVTVPAAVAAGNGLVLIATGAAGSAMTAPAGWTQVDTVTSSALTSTVWQRVATVSDPNSTVTVTFPSVYHGTVQLLAYSGTNATNPVVGTAKRLTAVSTTSYATPGANVPATGDFVISYWTAKSSTITAWTAPGGQTVRSTAYGSGGGRVSSLATDGGPVSSGPSAGLTATTDVAGSTFAAWTIVLGS